MRFSTKILVRCAALLALATALSFVKYHMPQGGSVTLCSMFFVALIGYYYGPIIGLTGAVAYGLVQFALGPYVSHPLSILLDYPLAFGMLGLSGFFRNQKQGLYLGFCLGALMRGVMSTISGAVFFYMYAGDQNPWLYSATYNATYILPEIALTAVIISIPIVKNTINRFKD